MDELFHPGMRCGAMVTTAVVASSVAASSSAQRPDVSDVLDALRADIARQEKAVRIVAWTADCATTIGPELQRGGELQTRVVLETKANGRAHADGAGADAEVARRCRRSARPAGAARPAAR